MSLSTEELDKMIEEQEILGHQRLHPDPALSVSVGLSSWQAKEEDVGSGRT